MVDSAVCVDDDLIHVVFCIGNGDARFDTSTLPTKPPDCNGCDGAAFWEPQIKARAVANIPP